MDHRLNQDLAGGEVTVDRHAPESRLGGDIAHAGIRVSSETRLGGLEDQLDVAARVGARLLRCLSG
jgi:hypothetical protein